MPKNKYRIYIVTMPYPKEKKATVRMVSMKLVKNLPPQPFFFAKDIAKLFHTDSKTVLKLAVPHVDAIQKTKLISLRGYFQVCFFGKSKINKPIQHEATKMLIEAMYKHTIRFYLNIIGGSKHGNDKSKTKEDK